MPAMRQRNHGRNEELQRQYESIRNGRNEDRGKFILTYCQRFYQSDGLGGFGDIGYVPNIELLEGPFAYLKQDGTIEALGGDSAMVSIPTETKQNDDEIKVTLLTPHRAVEMAGKGNSSVLRIFSKAFERYENVYDLFSRIVDHETAHAVNYKFGFPYELCTWLPEGSNASAQDLIDEGNIQDGQKLDFYLTLQDLLAYRMQLASGNFPDKISDKERRHILKDYKRNFERLSKFPESSLRKDLTAVLDPKKLKR